MDTTREWEKILANDAADRLYREFKKVSSESINPINNWANKVKLGSEDNVQQTHEKSPISQEKNKFTQH